jgi:proliferating cell nuclear antigen PCNA
MVRKDGSKTLTKNKNNKSIKQAKTKKVRDDEIEDDVVDAKKQRNIKKKNIKNKKDHNDEIADNTDDVKKQKKLKNKNIKNKKKSQETQNDDEIEIDDEDIDIKKSKKNKINKKDNKKGKTKNSSEAQTDDMESDQFQNDKKILVIKTTQTGAFKQAIERISNVITDCCMMFIPPDENKKDDDDSDDDDDIEDEKISKKNTNKKNKKNNQKDTGKKNKKSSSNINDDEEMNDPKKKQKKQKNKNDESDSDQMNDPKKKQNNETPKKNQGGIRILRLTEDKSILIKLNLDADKFEYFRCDEPKITIGVDMQNLHSLLKMVNDNYPIILYMNKDNRSALYIRSLNEDNRSSEETDIEVYLMDIGNPDMPIPRTEFQNKISMASDKFHTICKHLNNNSTYVEIASVDNEISFRGHNEGGKVTMFYRDSNFHVKKKIKTKKVVQGVYELKNLMSFSKCNKLCETVDIYLKNDFPLVLVISVASLGKMYIFLSPVEHPNQ